MSKKKKAIHFDPATVKFGLFSTATHPGSQFIEDLLQNRHKYTSDRTISKILQKYIYVAADHERWDHVQLICESRFLKKHPLLYFINEALKDKAAALENFEAPLKKILSQKQKRRVRKDLKFIIFHFGELIARVISERKIELPPDIKYSLLVQLSEDALSEKDNKASSQTLLLCLLSMNFSFAFKKKKFIKIMLNLLKNRNFEAIKLAIENKITQDLPYLLQYRLCAETKVNWNEYQKKTNITPQATPTSVILKSKIKFWVNYCTRSLYDLFTFKSIRVALYKSYKRFYESLYLLLFRKNVQVLNIPMVLKGIGHQIIEPVSFIKESFSHESRSKPILFFSSLLSYSFSKRPHINDALLRYLKPYFSMIVFEWHESFWERLKFKLMAPILYPELFELNRHQTMTLEVCARHIMTELRSNATMFETHAKYKAHLFQIAKKDLNIGRSFLKLHKIPQSAWFTTCHIRTQKFYQGIEYETEYANRCANINDYQLAIQKIVDHGGYCIFIGNDPELLTPEIEKFKDKVINVANTNFCETKLSPFLFSQAKFFLGCNSGPSIISGNFGVPTVQVNTSPFWGIPIHHFDLFIFKTLFSQKKQRILTLEEMFEAPLTYSNLDSQFRKLKLTPIDNTPEEIADVVEEMILRCFYSTETNDENQRRQDRFNSLFPKNCYGAKYTAQVGHKFLENLEYQSSIINAQSSYKEQINV